jgi:ABC-2 type transport system permease protein
VSAASATDAPRLGPARALARRGFRDGRTRTLAFAWLFALYSYIEPAGFRSGYPTLADRLAFAHSFANNDAIRLFYGYPYDPVSIAGYSAWRVGGTLAIAAAVLGVLAAVRALRAEEDAGRTELVLAGAVRREAAFGAAIAAVAAGVALVWVAETAGFIAGALPVGGSAYLALATVSVTAVFVGVGALVCQLAPTRRIALELGLAVVALSLLLRVVADTSSGVGWLRWLTPLGWAEELRPFTSPQPLVLIAPLAATVVLLAVAARIAAGRDTGTGLLPARDSRAPRLRLLSSPLAQAARSERGSLIAWTASTAAFALVLGIVSKSVSSAGIPSNLRKEFAKLGSGSIVTPSGYLSFVFIFFILAVSLFACAQIGAARQEESSEQLETLLSQPVSRQRWLGGRLLLAVAAAALLSLVAGLMTWAGAVSEGVAISLGHGLEAGANCLPVALCFLGLAALAYAVVPRASSGIAYSLVTLAFVWYLIGALVGVPHWLVELTPFAHVGFVPTQQFRTGSALAMLAIGAAAALLALAVFRRRDLANA